MLPYVTDKGKFTAGDLLQHGAVHTSWIWSHLLGDGGVQEEALQHPGEHSATQREGVV